MEEILKYENRDKLYHFLIDNFGLKKIEEHYDPETFGNFYIILSANDFLLSYVNDRSFLTIDIASKLEPSQGFSLSFVKDLICNQENINNEEQTDNCTRINELNDFLRGNFSEVSRLFSADNYYKTKTKIEELLKQQFQKRNSGMIE